MGNNKISCLDLLHFRGLNHLKLDDLSTINVFVGANNSGKTSILEAIKLLLERGDDGSLIRLALLRSRSNSVMRKKYLVNYLLSLFQLSKDGEHQSYCINLKGTIEGHDYKYDADATIGEQYSSTGHVADTLELGVSTSTDNKKRKYKLYTIRNNSEYVYSSDESPICNSLYFHSGVHYYYACVKYLIEKIVRDEKKEIVDMLHFFDPNIEDINVVGEDIYISNKFSGSLPLFAYGSGIQKAILIIISIARCKDGIILIDEIDNAIHMSMFKEVFGWFVAACKQFNVQAFITTHSAEAIDAIINYVCQTNSDEDILRVVTLRKDYNSNITRAKVRDAATAYRDREDYGMELRI